MGKKKVQGNKYLQMDLYMKDNGKRIKKQDMVKEFEFMEMESIQVNLRIIRDVEMESIFGVMVNIMRVNLNRIKEMNMVRFIIYIRMVHMMVK